MKKLLMFVVFSLMSVVAYADEPVVTIPTSLELRQGFIIPWENPEQGFSNMSTVSILKTHAEDSFGKWNALWDGWSVDAAWAYDSNTSSVGLMVGRHFGTLGKYLPIDYPLADKVDVSIYPVGILVDHPFDNPEVRGASGASIIKFDVSF